MPRDVNTLARKATLRMRRAVNRVADDLVAEIAIDLVDAAFRQTRNVELVPKRAVRKRRKAA